MFVDKMTPAERMRALLMGEKIDRVTCIPFTIGYTARVSGFSIGDFYKNPKTCVRAQLLAAELHGYEQPILYGYAAFGAWEFGAEVELPYKEGMSAPVVKKPCVEKPEDVDKLEVPDPKTAGSIPIALEVARQAVKLGMSAAPQVGLPFTMAGNIIGPQRMLLWLIEKPELVHRVLRMATDFVIDNAKLYAREFGPERCLAFDGGPLESNYLISPEQFEKFVLPYAKEIHEKVLSMGYPMFFSHICGEHNKNLKHWKKIPYGKPGILSFGREVDLEVLKREFGKEHIIMGNVDPPSIMVKSYDEVLKLCRDCVEKGKDNPTGYILGAGCEVPPYSPPVNVHAMMKAVREYGRY